MWIAVVSFGALLVAGACGSDGAHPQPDAAPQQPDGSGPSADGGVPAQTEVEGAFEGSEFRLTYADVAWEDPLHIVCVSNRAIVAPDCGYSDPEPKVVLYGKFVVQDGQGMWAFPQVELRVIGPAPRVKLAISGTMDVVLYDPGGDRFAASIDLAFDGAAAAGTIFVAP